MKVYTADELHAVLKSHLAWLKDEINGACANLRDAKLSDANLSGADLSGANLRGADLSGANLSGAYLRDANLRRANLRDADLRYANLSDANLRAAKLSGANLSRADLSGANLSRADLSGANLSDADLSAANLSDANMPGGYTFEVYKSDVVPALLTAGGKSLADVVSNAWDCHSWTNCPMAFAFGVNEIDQIPILHRENARLFIQLFDANLLPRPEIPDEEAVPA
jgi:uncharacterized protein YjbI with pentapeptide repeats